MQKNVRKENMYTKNVILRRSPINLRNTWSQGQKSIYTTEEEEKAFMLHEGSLTFRISSGHQILENSELIKEKSQFHR